VEDESDLDYPIFSLFYFRYEAVWFEVNEENCLPVLITTVVAEVLQPLDQGVSDSAFQAALGSHLQSQQQESDLRLVITNDSFCH
jgi:hypothetical protein